MIESVARFLDPNLRANGAAVMITTQAHREALAEELQARGIDVPAAVQKGCYIALDAAEVLASFMVEGWPDGALFKAAIAPVIAKAQASAIEGRVAAFGEMVALLWAEGKREAAVRLEQLWNELGREISFSLFCSYPLSIFGSEEDRKLFFRVCGEHSDVNPTEEYPAFGSERQRRRAVAKLQQKTLALQEKTRALEEEIRLSQERVIMLQEASGVGSWEMDLVDETLSFSSSASQMLGLPTHTFPLSEFLELIRYSGDRDRFFAAVNRARTGRKEFVTEFRINIEGEVRVLSIRGRTVYNGGQPLILGVLSDLTPASR